MAIINSTVMGKSTGKIGNVVTTILKGQVIAKSRNYHPANPKTEGQVNSRGKMSNAVKAWQFLSIFLVHINALRKPVESNYNAFIRLAKNLFQEAVAATASEAAGQLVDLSVGSSNFATVTSTVVNAGAIIVNFNNGGLPWVSDTKVRVLSFDSVSGNQKVTEMAVSEVAWNAETITVAGAGSAGTNCAGYLYSSMEKKCSTIAFGNL